LTGGRKEVKRVAHDTILFEEGVLGKTPTGLVSFLFLFFINKNYKTP